MASLTFAEKVKILEKLRDRERLIAAVREELRAERLSQRLKVEQDKESK